MNYHKGKQEKTKKLFQNQLLLIQTKLNIYDRRNEGAMNCAAIVRDVKNTD
jgi:hypothetical protein